MRGKSALIISTQNSGKTTLLQELLNFILGLSEEDGFRFGFGPEIMNTVWVIFNISFFKKKNKCQSTW